MRFATWLIRFLSRIELFQFKYLLRSKSLSLHLIRLQLRNKFFPTILEGDDPEIDRLIGLTTLSLVRWELDNKSAITADEETKVGAIISTASDVTNLRDSLATYLGIEKLIHQISGKASTGHPDSLLLGGEEIPPKKIPLKNLYKTNKKLRVAIKELKCKISDRKGEKISLDFTSLTQALSLISICFLLTGYLYSSVFLSHFGISVTQYFSVSDYLATSLDKVESSVVASIGALLGLGLGILSRSRMSEEQVSSVRGKEPEWFWYVAKVILVCALVWMYFAERENFYRILPFAGAILFLDVLVNISTRFFHQPIKAMFTLSFISLYGLAFFSGIRLDLEQIKTGNYWKKHSETLAISPDTGIDASDSLLLYTSGEYFFLIQKKSGTPIIIPRDKVLRVDINHLTQQ